MSFDFFIMFTFIRSCVLKIILCNAIMKHFRDEKKNQCNAYTLEQELIIYHLKNQALCEYCTYMYVNKSTHNIADDLISLFPFSYNHVRRDSSLRNTYVVMHMHLNFALNRLYT